VPLIKRSLRVKDSETHGKGLYATTPIKKGTLLGFCQAKRTTSPGEHTLWIDAETPWDIVCRLRYINHSRNKANVSYYDDLSVVALRNIRPGEELLHDYGAEWK
jgi:SET domain-containing protein